MADAPAEGQRTKRRGCLIWCCSVIAVFLLVFIGAVAYMGYTLYRYTSPEPVPVPVYQPAPGEVEKVKRRLAQYEKSVKAGESSRLTLTADDVNSMIAGTPAGERYSGKVFVRIEGDRVYADVSLPLSELKPLGVDALSGRYLNGTAELEARVDEEGKPVLAVENLVAAGKQLPESYLSHLRARNLLEHLPAGKLSELGGELSRIEVKDGKILLESRAP